VRSVSVPFSLKFGTGTRRIGVWVKRKFFSESRCINPHSVKFLKLGMFTCAVDWTWPEAWTPSRVCVSQP